MNYKDFIVRVSLPGEEWKELIDYDGYLFSSLGRVLSLMNKTPRFLSQTVLTNRGREYSYSCFGKKHNKKATHRLIALAFIPNPNNLPEVDHINNVGTDNRVCNLRWCTHKENMNNPITQINKEVYYPRAELLRSNLDNPVKIFRCDNKDKSKKVAQCKGDEIIKVYESLGDAERSGFLKTSVSAACHGRLKTYRGFTWRFM